MKKQGKLDRYLRKSAKKAPPRNSHKVTRPRKKTKSPTETQSQLIIDAGQKKLKAVTCNRCGSLYYPGLKDDEDIHRKICMKEAVLNVRSKVKFDSYYEDFEDDFRIARICHNTKNKTHKRIFDNLLEYVDMCLGFTKSKDPRSKKNFQVFLCLHTPLTDSKTKRNLTPLQKVSASIFKNSSPTSSASKIVGACFVESIDFCHKTLPNKMEYDKKVKTKCLLGISRIWVKDSHRRKKIATKLVDIVRKNMIYGYSVDKAFVAFSHPTTLGYSFATKYMNSDMINVY